MTDELTRRMEKMEYELIDIVFEIETKSNVRMVCDDSEISYEPFEYDENGIPKGSSEKETIIRRSIIHEFIQNWRAAHPDPRIFNDELKDYIKVNQVFLLESVSHASIKYLSTKAVLQMDTIMAKAIPIGLSKTKPNNSNQKPFKQMLVMVYKSKELGSVKMTVGIRHRTEEKVEYSITVPTPGTPFIEKGMRTDQKEYKKASHKK